MPRAADDRESLSTDVSRRSPGGPAPRSYVALLRGINVGGRNLIRMSELAECFVSHGFAAVSTYIQSGNVLFRSADEGRTELVARIEQMLSGAFDYQARVTLRDASEMRAVIDLAPAGFGTESERFRYDVAFLVPPLTPEPGVTA